jgi:predicted transcriptional regulator
MVSSIFIPDLELIHDLYRGHRETRAILTEELLHSRIELVGRKQLKKTIEKNLKLYVVRKTPKIGFFTVTDRFIAFVPYRLDGTFDWFSDLISCNKKAIDWGLALFNHYAKIAESVDL